MLEKLKLEVYKANLLLPEYGLVIFTWGNVSAVSREHGRIVIKPSGVAYEDLTPENMAVTDLSGRKTEKEGYDPSSDTLTHAVLYERFPEIGAVVHTHSPWATSWAQAGRDIPCYGTTHADYIFGEIPCVRGLTGEEIEGEYEKNTGLAIAEEIEKRGKDPFMTPVVLCRGHGVFAWGRDAEEAVHNAAAAEEIAKMAARTEQISPFAEPVPETLKNRHYFRKHGADAYYGQKRSVSEETGSEGS